MNGFWVCGIISIIIYTLLYDWWFIAIYSLVVGGYFAMSWAFVPGSAMKFNTLRRKLAISTWSDPDSPEVYGHTSIRISKALDFLERYNLKYGKKITLTHLVMKAIADIMATNREFSGKLAFGCYNPYQTIDISCLVTLDDDKDLSFVCVSEVDKKSLGEIYDECISKLKSLRTGGEALKTHKKSTSVFSLVPGSIGGVLMEISSFLAIPLGMDLGFLGIKKHPLGSVIVTNVGSQGVEIGYAPFPSAVRVPVVIAISSLKTEPVVEDGRIVIDKVTTLMATMDHRFGDGTRGIKAINEIMKILKNPDEFYMKD